MKYILNFTIAEILLSKLKIFYPYGLNGLLNSTAYLNNLDFLLIAFSELSMKIYFFVCHPMIRL